MRCALVAGVWLLAASAAAFAQQSTWFDLTVPGSLERILGPEVRAPAGPRLLRDLIGAFHDVNSAPANRTATATFRACLADLQQLRTHWAAVTRAAGEVSLRAAAESPGGQRAMLSLLELFGLGLALDGSAWRVALDPDERRRDVCGAGVDWGSAAVERRLNAGAALPWDVPSFVVSLPLSPRVWLEVVYSDAVESEAAAATRAAEMAADLTGRLLTDARAAQLYLGLAALDDDTLAWLRQRPQLLFRLDDERLTAFARFGGSLRIRDGEVRVPGGPGAVPFWARLVGIAVDEPERFVERLFERSSGRVAEVYDLVARLPEEHRQFVLGAWRTGERDRRRGLSTLWRVLETLSPPEPVFANPAAVRPADVDLLVERGPGASICGVPPGEALALTWELDLRRLEVNPVVGPGGRRLVTLQNRFHACGPHRCTFRGYSNELFALQDVGVDLGHEGTRYTCRVQAVMDFPNEYHGHPEVMLHLRGVRQPRPARMYRLGRPLEPAGADRREFIEGSQ